MLILKYHCDTCVKKFHLVRRQLGRMRSGLHVKQGFRANALVLPGEPDPQHTGAGLILG